MIDYTYCEEKRVVVSSPIDSPSCIVVSVQGAGVTTCVPVCPWLAGLDTNFKPMPVSQPVVMPKKMMRMPRD